MVECKAFPIPADTRPLMYEPLETDYPIDSAASRRDPSTILTNPVACNPHLANPSGAAYLLHMDGDVEQVKNIVEHPCCPHESLHNFQAGYDQEVRREQSHRIGSRLYAFESAVTSCW